MHRTGVRSGARPYVRRRRLVGAGMLALGLWVGVPAAANALHGGGEVEHAPTARYVVRPGDTLWDIAAAAAPGRDPRPVVDLIGAVNGVGAGDLVPGQVLVVPAG